MHPPVASSWQQIDAWLAAHAPASFAKLNPPADPAEVCVAEREMGLAFPAGLRESLACHDGLSDWAVVLPFGELLSTRRIVEHWHMCMEVLADVVYAEPPAEPWWHPLWIPWAESAGGDSQIIDMRPGTAQGRVGRAVHDDGGSFDDPWPTLAACLDAIAQALYQGADVDGWYPYLIEGRQEIWWSPGPDETRLNDEVLVRAPVGLASPPISPSE